MTLQQHTNFPRVCFAIAWAPLAAAVLLSACVSEPPRDAGNRATVAVPSAPAKSTEPFVQYGRVKKVATVSPDAQRVDSGAVLGGPGYQAPAIHQVARVTVKFDDGNESIYEFPGAAGLKVGDRVRSEGGQLHRQ